MRLIYGEAEGAEDFVRIVEAHAVLGRHPIPIPLRLSKLFPGCGKLLVRCPRRHGRLHRQVRLGHRLPGNALDAERVVVDGLDPCRQRLRALRVALLAGSLDGL